MKKVFGIAVLVALFWSAPVAAQLGEVFQLTVAHVTTTDNTPASPFLVYMPENSLTALEYQVLARSTSGVVAVWRKQAVIKRGTGAVSSVGLVDLTPPVKELGAALWTVTFDIVDENYYVTVQGVNGVDIDWAIRIDGVVFAP
jgi:hypothetical protein